MSEVPDPEVAYDIVFQRSGTVQPVATIKLVPPEGGSEGDPTWELQPVGSLFEIERIDGGDSFVVPHGTRPVGLAFTISYVGEPLFVPPEAIKALPEVAVPTAPTSLPTGIVAMDSPPVLVAAGTVAVLSDDDRHNAIPAFTEAYEALKSLAREFERADGRGRRAPVPVDRAGSDTTRSGRAGVAGHRRRWRHRRREAGAAAVARESNGAGRAGARESLGNHRR